MVVPRRRAATRPGAGPPTPSDGFTVEPAERASAGTSVILHLKRRPEGLPPDAGSLRELVQKYSDFVGHPIELRREGGAQGGRGAQGRGARLRGDQPGERALAAAAQARSPTEQYEEFYKHLTHDWEEPLAWTHFKVEGTQEFTGLLYVPRRRPSTSTLRAKGAAGVQPLREARLHHGRLRRAAAARGCASCAALVDSDDLPLNVSRETLQDSAVVRAIKKQVAKKTLDRLDELAKDDARRTTRPSGRSSARVAQGGPAPSTTSTASASGSSVRFESSHGDGHHLARGVRRAHEGGAGGDLLRPSASRGRRPPSRRTWRRCATRGYEVLYLTDPIDTLAADGLREFQGKKLVNVAMAPTSSSTRAAEAKQERGGRREARSSRSSSAREVGARRAGATRCAARRGSRTRPACLVVPPGGDEPRDGAPAARPRARGAAVRRGCSSSTRRTR
ncbi:MAG: hypothetical protein V9F06_00255 [Thermomicrobiales bacterium]